MKRRDLVLHHKVGHTALSVHRGPTKLVRGDILAEHRLHNTGPCEPKEGVLGLDNKATLAWEIGATASVKAKHTHDRGYHPTHLAERGKGLCVAL